MGLRALVLGCLLATGCTATWTAHARQPRLVLGADLETRRSVPLSIVVRDMELPRFVRLPNSAYYVMVSRDRITFHVTLHHKWDEMADIRTWAVWLEDETGERMYPEDISLRGLRALPMPTKKPVYRGTADIKFYKRDVFAATQRLTLVLQKPGYVLRYTWDSVDERYAMCADIDRTSVPWALANRVH